jgi:C1A family cysteine protease
MKKETVMKRYNWEPDLPDQRDYAYKPTVGAIPRKMDLRKLCSPVEDQGNLGSCTGNALVGAMEVLENLGKTTFVDLSRLFVYYNERVIEGTVRQDSGAMIRDGVKTLAKMGVCKEQLWPYNIAKFKSKPTKGCFSEGLSRKVSVYSRLETTDDMRNCLASGFPFVFGFSVYDSFESDEVAKTGTVPMPGKKEKLLGGHAVLAVGYDDDSKRFIVRNSWGSGWGDKGYFTIPYAYLANRNLSDDFWQIKK